MADQTSDISDRIPLCFIPNIIIGIDDETITIVLSSEKYISSTTAEATTTMHFLL